MKGAVVLQCGQSVGDFLRLRLTAGYGEELRRDEIDEAAALGKFSDQGMRCVGLISIQLDPECEISSVVLHTRRNERILSGSHHAHAVAEIEVVDICGDT